MGCFHSQDGIPESDSNVETLYLARRVRSKKIQNSAAKASGSQFNDITADVSKDKTFQSKNLAAEVNNSSKDVQGKAYSIFPKWKGYKMCNACEDTESKTVNKGFKHRGHCNRCSMVKEMKNNLRKNSPQSMNITAFANLLALVSIIARFYKVMEGGRYSFLYSFMV